MSYHKKLTIGLFGFGVVGEGLYRILQQTLGWIGSNLNLQNSTLNLHLFLLKASHRVFYQVVVRSNAGLVW
jgi:homoserine dehydrogenase